MKEETVTRVIPDPSGHGWCIKRGAFYGYRNLSRQKAIECAQHLGFPVVADPQSLRP